MDAFYEALAYEATHGSDDEILAEARERFAAGVAMRGLPKPHDAPPAAWYAVRREKLTDGTTAAYLFLRWRYSDQAGGKRARSLGRLN